MAQFEPVLTRYVKEPGSYTLDFYVQHGGYEACLLYTSPSPRDS